MIFSNFKVPNIRTIIGKYLNSWIGDLKGIKKEGTFIQNFAFVFTGNFLYILIQFVSAPILSRIYSPEAYGLFGIFNAIITNVAMVATLSYPNALILPKENRKFITLLQICLILIIAMSFISFLLIIVWGEYLLAMVNAEHLGFIKYLIPVGVLMVGINQIIAQWITREKEFKKSLQVGPATSAVIKTTNIAYGIFTQGAVYGIVFIDLLGKILGFFVNVFLILKNKTRDLFVRPQKESLQNVALEYSRFPKYIFPGGYINMLSSQLPVYFLGFYFGNTILGYFSFASGLLDMPMRVLGNAVSPVFYQKATEVSHSRPEDLKDITLKLFNRLLLVGILPFTFITVFGDKIFFLIFGEQWSQAGLFAGFMSVYYFFRLVSSPLSSLFNVLGKERILFRFQVWFFLIRFIALGSGVVFFDDPVITLFLFSLASGASYIVLNMMVFKMIGVETGRIIFKTILALVVGLGFWGLLRYLIF